MVSVKLVYYICVLRLPFKKCLKEKGFSIVPHKRWTDSKTYMLEVGRFVFFFRMWCQMFSPLAYIDSQQCSGEPVVSTSAFIVGQNEMIPFWLRSKLGREAHSVHRWWCHYVFTGVDTMTGTSHDYMNYTISTQSCRSLLSHTTLRKAQYAILSTK